MDQIPARPGIAGPYRRVLGYLEKYLPLGRVDPAWYQVVGVGLSFAFLYPIAVGWKIVLLRGILVLDWLDGAGARRMGLGGSKAGYIMDVTADRLSEGLIFARYLLEGNVWVFGIFLVNLAATFYSVKSGRHMSLPMRFGLLVYLLLFSR